jgi:hypothetical protein
MLKKHTEAWVTKSPGPVMTPDLLKNCDNDLEGSRTGESSEETATTPSSIKHNRSKLTQNYLPKKLSIEASIKNRRLPKTNKPPMPCDGILLSNHLEGHIHLSNKKALYYNMKTYYESIGENPFDYLPLTFHIKEGVESEEFSRFAEEFKRTEESTLEEIIEKK